MCALYIFLFYFNIIWKYKIKHCTHTIRRFTVNEGWTTAFFKYSSRNWIFSLSRWKDCDKHTHTQCRAKNSLILVNSVHAVICVYSIVWYQMCVCVSMYQLPFYAPSLTFSLFLPQLFVCPFVIVQLLLQLAVCLHRHFCFHVYPFSHSLLIFFLQFLRQLFLNPMEDNEIWQQISLNYQHIIPSKNRIASIDFKPIWSSFTFIHYKIVINFNPLIFYYFIELENNSILNEWQNDCEHTHTRTIWIVIIECPEWPATNKYTTFTANIVRSITAVRKVQYGTLIFWFFFFFNLSKLIFEFLYTSAHTLAKQSRTRVICTLSNPVCFYLRHLRDRKLILSINS